VQTSERTWVKNCGSLLIDQTLNIIVFAIEVLSVKKMIFEEERNNNVEQNVTSYLHKLSELLLSTCVTDQYDRGLRLDEGTRKAIELLLQVKSTSRKAMVIGNGGSAAIASHTQNDLCKAVGLRAVGMYEVPLLTALSNDYSYEDVFEREIEFWADKGDLLIAISSSGRSENILRAVRTALQHECSVITLSGFQADNPLRRMGHLNFYVPAETYGYVETAHAVLTHLFTDYAMQLQPPQESEKS
jgi:D-sedoheptulose 7-phosphate isomerase